ncbi:MAG: TonB-dependent receptor [Acidobacteria bacterium]|nr:TonB-dependent receptor [Acidobacteriota bacterium]
MLRVNLCLALAAAALLAAPAFAQNRATTAEIVGLLEDSTGGVLPGVTVTVVNLDDGLVRSAVSDGGGRYAVMLLPPGRYDVRAELSGFGAGELDGVALTVGASRTINFTLAPAGLAEVVTVTAETSVVETTTDTSDVTLDSQAIANLPINGRRFHDFVSLTPTAQVEPQRGQISLAGQRGINGNVSIDGADYNQPFFGGIRGGERSQFTFTIPQEAIREFRVVKAGYSPEFGRSTGGLVNAITKSGANDTSGTAFYLLRPEQLAAQNAFGQDAAPTQHQFGGSLGGTLARNRAFYFVAYEQQEFKAPREVRFARLDGFKPTAASREGYDHFRQFETPFEVTNDARAWLARIDMNLAPGNRFNVRYNGSTNEALNSDGVGGVITPTTHRSLETNGTEEDSTQTVVGQFTSVPSSDFLFELRGQYSREDRPRSANALAPLVDLSLGEFGTRSFRPTTQYDWRAQAGGNATWLAGGHSVKAGFDYNHVFIDQEFGFYQNGGYLVFGSDVETTLDIIGVGGAIPNRFGSSSLLYVQQIGNLRASFATDEVGLFIQDEWRVSPTLTVNYGLRWDGQFNPTPAADNDVLRDQLRGVTFPIGRTVDPTAIPSSGRQFGPRAGFAWDPTGAAKTVVRGFAGIYYARTPLLLMAGPVNNFRVPPGDLTVALPFRVPPGSPHVTLYDQLRLIGIDLNERTLDNLPTLTADQMTAIATALGIENNPFAGARVTLMDEDFRNPMARQAGGGVQHEVSPGWSLGADLLVVDTIHLHRNRDLNVPPPTTRPDDPAQRPFFGLRSGTARPVPALDSVTVRESTASALYRALTVSSELRRPWGQLNTYYVLSKNESSDDNERSASGVSYENGYDLAAEYGPSALDRRHQFHLHAVFALPGAIDLSTGMYALSGAPFDARMGTDSNEDRGGADRPYSAPGVPFTRNAFRDKPIADVNLRVQKRFALGGGRQALVSLELFNLFNLDNVTLDQGYSTVANYCASSGYTACGLSGLPTNPDFARTRGADGEYLTGNIPGPPFQMQIGFRLLF